MNCRCIRSKLEMQNEELQRAQAGAEEASSRYYDLFDFAPVGYFLWDQEGRILEVNLAGTALLGWDRSRVVQSRFAQFVAVEDRVRFANFCHQVLLAPGQQTCEVKLLKGRAGCRRAGQGPGRRRSPRGG